MSKEEFGYVYMEKINALAKVNGLIAYVFDFEKKDWVRDDNTFMDLFLGYDDLEPERGIGNLGSMADYVELTEEEAIKMIEAAG